VSDNWLSINYIIVTENFILLQVHALIIEGSYRVPQFKLLSVSH
jgi:hypothetical protein